MIQGKNIYNFGIPERLRTLRYSIFTGGVVEENGSCRACFLRKQSRSGGTPSVKAYGFATFPKGTAFARGRQSLRLKRKACGRACSPLGELSRSD